jgi:hypothetical protein
MDPLIQVTTGLTVFGISMRSHINGNIIIIMFYVMTIHDQFYKH